jgi:hypothetical protein
VRVWFASASLLLATSLALVGCDNPTEPRVCTAIAVDAIVVTVVDASSNQRICDAAVVAVDGSFRAELRPFPGSPPECTYSGPTERAGTYEVRVSQPGYEPVSQTGIRVTADECHVIPVRVTIQMRRSGA